jgi:hypothetical protein
LSFKEQEVVEKHLDVCPACAAEKTSLLLISSLMDEIPPEDIAPSFAERVAANARADIEKPRSLPFLNPAFAGIIIILVLLIGVVKFHPKNESEPRRYEYLMDFDDFPPGSYSRLYMSSVKGTVK